MQSLKDRHVVVTGGTGALGSAVAKALIEAGATAMCRRSRARGRPTTSPTGKV